MNSTALAYSRIPPGRIKSNQPPSARASKLWLCAYFPDLALESLNLDLARPVATLESIKGRPVLQALSGPALQAGIESGMTPAAALALCCDLTICERDARAEALAMEKLAQAALMFSPRLSLDKPQCLLLEIRSCLSLFGGAESLREKLRDALLASNHRPVIAISPSAEASLLLAELGREIFIADSKALRSALGTVPIDALALAQKTQQCLLRTGIHQLTDLWRLPRDGLARRYGAPLLRRIDALLGLSDSVLNSYQPAASFHARRDMPAELQRLDHFFPAIVQLAAEFADFLRAGDRMALGLELAILHHGRPATRLKFDFRRGSRDSGHWLDLVREKLERSPLPAPVTAVNLSGKAIAAFKPERFSLFDDEVSGGEGEWQAVLDQLQARLGHTALKTLSLQNDYRPECASGVQASHQLQSLHLPERPLWLLVKPEAVDIRTLQIQDEAERIESGWWDGAAVRRDYRVAKDKRGRKLWLFNDLNSRAWFLHGLFG